MKRISIIVIVALLLSYACTSPSSKEPDTPPVDSTTLFNDSTAAATLMNQ